MTHPSLPLSGWYQNPVYPASAQNAAGCPDPFALKFAGEYWCYCTGVDADGCFPILHSTDLVHWQPVGRAMPPLPGGYTQYWAPEVDYRNGTFYLYYAVGDGEAMHLCVATAADPAGPFSDSGHRLTREEFAIDAHVFIDDDGSRWLFYATDFLAHNRVGTGTVMDRLIDPYTLAGHPRPVTRARYDWQIYDPQRAEKGGACWHTLEGPFVLKHAGRYYQMFSGGNWQNASYGVGYATADRLDGQDEWAQCCDGVERLPVLRSLPAEGIIGPGHNSVVRGPNNRELFVVYHRWWKEVNNRVLAIDRLGWQGDQLVTPGPTASAQPAPRPADIAGFAEFAALAGNLHVAGGRLLLRSAVEQRQVLEPALAELRFPQDAAPNRFVLEISLRMPRLSLMGQVGVVLAGPSETQDGLVFIERTGGVELLCALTGEEMPLPEEFDAGVFHLLRAEAEGNEVTWWIDGKRVGHCTLPGPVQSLCLECSGAEAEWAGFALTLE